MQLRFPRLGPKQQKGSKPRCHLLTDGETTEVAARLTALIEPWGTVRPADLWMPYGFQRCEEAQLHSAADLLPKRTDREAVRDWWLHVGRAVIRTPNFDLASTCLVQGEPGILLVEAKAHDYELHKEEKGKELSEASSVGSKKNHEQIGRAIGDANKSLTEETGLPWSLSRDTHYQMSNRFAWAWKLTDLGMPVILLYLGFLDCEEMRGKAQRPLTSDDDWKLLVLDHSRSLFPSKVWNRCWNVKGESFIPIISSTSQQLC